MGSTRLRSAAVALLALAAFGVGLAAAPVAQEGDKGKGKGDKQLFQGKWEVVSAEKGGEKLPDEILQAIKLEVKGDKIIVQILGENKEGTYKLDPSKKPKAIDMTMEEKTVKGIYELTQNSLKVCSAIDENGARPKDFKGAEDNLLVTFKRVGGAKKPPQEKKDKKETSFATGGQGEAEARARLQGDWKVVAAQKGGEKLPDEFIMAIKLKFTKDKMEVKILGETKQGTYEVGPTKKPATIDLTIDGKTALGIYEVTKDTLKICAAEPGQPRPKQFNAEGEQMLMTLKRVQAPKEEGKKEEEQQVRAEAAECAQQGALKTASANNLKIIGLAMHNYADANRGAFPPAAIYDKEGKPLLSWRVALLPYLDKGGLMKEFKLDEPWDSEHNKKLLDKMPKVYAPVGVDAKEPNSTFYRVFAGPGTIFEGTKGRRITGVTDGLSNTILAVEAGEAVPWTKPDPLPYDAGKPLPKLGGLFKDGFTVLMGDGSVRFLRRNADPQILRLAITCNDGQPVDLDKITQ